MSQTLDDRPFTKTALSDIIQLLWKLRHICLEKPIHFDDFWHSNMHKFKKKMKYRNQVKSKGFNVPCKQGNQGHILPDKVFQLHRRARMLNLLCLAKKRIFSCYIFSDQCSNKNTSFLENHETVKKYLHYHRTP